MSSRHPYIVISDADFDDLIAIAWLGICPEVDLKLICYAQAGWTHAPIGAENIAFMLQLNPDTTPPVVIGEERLSNDNMVIPNYLREEADSLWGLSLDKSNPISLSTNAAQAIIDCIEASPEPVTIIALAPLTDLALALQQKPSISQNIKKLTLMGGLPHVDGARDNFPGNVRLDIEAAVTVFQQSFPILTSGKVLNKNFPLNDPKFNSLQKSASTLITFIYELFCTMADVQTQFDAKQAHKKLYLWDVIAAFVAVFDRQHCLIETIHVALKPDAEKFHDTIVYQHNARELQHAVDIDLEAFDALFFKRLIDYGNQ